jgi:hypothetical protein
VKLLPFTLQEFEGKNINLWAAEWLKWYSACLASMRPSVKAPVPPKK